MFQKHLTTFLLIFYTLFCLACLSWSADPAVRVLKHAFYYVLSPSTTPLISEMDKWGRFGRNTAQLLSADQELRALKDMYEREQLDKRRLAEIESENRRLTDIMNLPPRVSYEPLPARVWMRDASDWFQSLLANRGRADGVEVSDAVVALQDGKEVLVGRVVEVFEKTCRIVLVTDPLSVVSSRVDRTHEQGAVEGQGSDRLLMNYLFSDSDVREGDEIFSAGLGGVFPDGILVGKVLSVERETRESFKRAILRPAVRVNRLEEVYVLRPRRERRAAP